MYGNKGSLEFSIPDVFRDLRGYTWAAFAWWFYEQAVNTASLGNNEGDSGYWSPAPFQKKIKKTKNPTGCPHVNLWELTWVWEGEHLKFTISSMQMTFFMSQIETSANRELWH